MFVLGARFWVTVDHLATSALHSLSDIVVLSCDVGEEPKAAASRLRKLAPRRPSANAVEALLDRGEAPVDHGFVLGVGEDVGPVIFDGLANQFADIKRIDAIVGPVLECLDGIGDRSFCRRQTADLPGEPPRHVATEIHDLSADDARTQHGYPDSPRRERLTHSFGQSHHSIFSHVILRTSSSNQPEGGRRGNNLASFAVRLDQRTENLDAPNHRHQIDAENPIPTCICPMTITPAAADPRILDENMDSSGARHSGIRSALAFCFNRYILYHAINVGVL